MQTECGLYRLIDGRNDDFKSFGLNAGAPVGGKNKETAVEFFTKFMKIDGAACFTDVIFHFLSENRPAEYQTVAFCIKKISVRKPF